MGKYFQDKDIQHLIPSLILKQIRTHLHQSMGPKRRRKNTKSTTQNKAFTIKELAKELQFNR
jgi:hypothetical protein